jgi:hydroxymethylglutaryl-CoA synthase
MSGITAYSVYVPRFRLDRGLIARAWGGTQPPGEIAVGNYDEDALTMATEATLACISDADVSRVDGCILPARARRIAKSKWPA